MTTEVLFIDRHKVQMKRLKNGEMTLKEILGTRRGKHVVSPTTIVV
jgi:hypothetical protein